MPEDVDDILGELSLTAPHSKSKSDGLPAADFLDDLPLSVSPLDRLVDYPATTYPGEESIVASTRIPMSWAAQFEEFRDKIGSRMPKTIWKRNSDLVRWCIGYAFQDLRKIQEQLDSGLAKPSPLLSAQLFLEQTGGALTARANVRADAKEKATKIAEALRDLMANSEYAEAADMITAWFEGARSLREVSPYWESTMIASLLRIADVPRIVVTLCNDGHITDPDIMDQYDGLVERAQAQSQEDPLDDLDLTPPEGDSSAHASKNSTRRSK